MRQILCFLILLLTGNSSFAQTSYADALNSKRVQLQVHYLQQFPLAYESEQGELTGIEIDLMASFADWLMRVKGVKATLIFLPYANFANVYDQVKGGQGAVFGLASAAITKERQKEVQFSPPYLRNTSVMVSNIDVPTLRAYPDMPMSFNNMTALVMRGTTLEAHMLEIRKKHFEKMRVSYVEHPRDIVKQIASTQNQYYGYVDILTYWAMLKEAPANVKIHRAVTLDNQKFGVLLPPSSDWKKAWDEFMEGGFGFTATEAYYNILRKHLGYEVLESVSM